jgi:excinuclease ABC subunit C
LVASRYMYDHKSFLKTVPPLPGVYMMYDEKDSVIYVGKARRLSLRLRSYFSGKKTDPKLIALTSKIRRIELMVTHSEQ